jgi:hypothetical protein
MALSAADVGSSASAFSQQSRAELWFSLAIAWWW